MTRPTIYPGERYRSEAPLLPMREPSTWAKVWAALSPVTWGEVLMAFMAAVAFCSLVLVGAVL